MQIQGNSNSKPNDKYYPYILAFLNKFQYKAEQYALPDSILNIDDEYYDIDNWPDTVISNKNDMDLQNNDITEFVKKKLVLNGTLNISYTNITKLPEYLEVQRLIINGLNIQKFPKHLKILNGDLSYNLEFNGFIKSIFPEILFINGNAKFHHMQIINLPKKIEVYGNLDFYNVDFLKGFPSNLSCYNLYINVGDLKKLPDNIKIKNTLSIYRIKNLKEIPSKLNVKRIIISKNLKDQIMIPNNLKKKVKYE